MNRFIISMCFVTLFFLAGCSTSNKNIVYQTSTIDALIAGVFDGDISLTMLASHGNFGIGTFDNLDGEMILLEGTFYQVKADGKIYQPTNTMETPFATVCNFNPDNQFNIPSGSTIQMVEDLINEKAPNQNLFYAIKIEGTFKNIKTRSVPEQKKPYPPLSEVTKTQPEFNMENISGTIVGFRCPAFVKGINVPGYHLHFISKDHRQGGHILGLEISSAVAQLDVLDQYVLQLPTDGEAFAKTDLSKDRSSELNRVEKEKQQ
ncbi:MAG: alpha-acetolactate decarboxylase [Candidatus Margulisbacteria bacterium GWF2_35_9]|nr:MAG: alpha-acetolactate decarboxylase [Candidatus Margulisbacteria bacterium GWF2_35_9]